MKKNLQTLPGPPTCQGTSFSGHVPEIGYDTIITNYPKGGAFTSAVISLLTLNNPGADQPPPNILSYRLRNNLHFE